MFPGPQAHPQLDRCGPTATSKSPSQQKATILATGDVQGVEQMLRSHTEDFFTLHSLRQNSFP